MGCGISLVCHYREAFLKNRPRVIFKLNAEQFLVTPSSLAILIPDPTFLIFSESTSEVAYSEIPVN